jgi:hypothetical protein
MRRIMSACAGTHFYLQRSHEQAALGRSFACFAEVVMPTKLKVFAMATVLAAGTSSVALAQYTCPAGYVYSAGVCQPAPAYPPGPVSGAVSGAQSGAARGGATGGPIGAVVGGAVGTATGTVAGTANAVTGTANALTGVPASTMCGPGFVYSNGYCYPSR